MFPQPGSGLEGIYGGKEGVFPRSFINESEDSFTLNVFGTGAKGEKLPVLYWIYGGSLNNGSSDKFLYDPTEWIRRSQADGKRFIVVTGNYRTNIFGFASSEDLRAADPQGLSGNYGLYDCVSSLEWIKANIANFGGDADNVTIFG
jgi:para-nitrobenzyl esterase